MYYSAVELTNVRPLIACAAGQAFWQQAGERRRRALSLQLALPPVATRNGLACLLLESLIFTHRLGGRGLIVYIVGSRGGESAAIPDSLTLTRLWVIHSGEVWDATEKSGIVRNGPFSIPG